MQENLFSDQSKLRNLFFDPTKSIKKETESEGSSTHLTVAENSQITLNVIYELDWLQEYQDSIVDLPQFKFNKN